MCRGEKEDPDNEDDEEGPRNQGQENSGYATDSFLRQISTAAGANADAALAQKGSAFAADRLTRANNDASALGINGTPTLTVQKISKR
jgi:protein-disulfide isomerase